MRPRPETKDGIPFEYGMTLYLAAGGRLIELDTTGMRFFAYPGGLSACRGELMLNDSTEISIKLWYGGYQNAAQAAIEQLQGQITDLQQDIEALQREINRRTKTAADESGRRGHDPELLRSDAVSWARPLSRRPTSVANG